MSHTKTVEYFGFVAIVGISQIKIKTIIKKIGDGNIIFWSVMPYSKLKNTTNQRLYTDDLETE